jgi:hypothetical protein
MDFSGCVKYGEKERINLCTGSVDRSTKGLDIESLDITALKM